MEQYKWPRRVGWHLGCRGFGHVFRLSSSTTERSFMCFSCGDHLFAADVEPIGAWTDMFKEVIVGRE
jgi:hypothetical protein